MPEFVIKNKDKYRLLFPALGFGHLAGEKPPARSQLRLPALLHHQAQAALIHGTQGRVGPLVLFHDVNNLPWTGMEEGVVS